MRRIIIPKEWEIKINWLIIIAGIGTFLFAILGAYTYNTISGVEINPFLFIAITVVPTFMAGYFTKKYVQSKSVHIFAPGGYFWSALMLNIKTVLLPITNREGQSLSIYFLIVPLEGGAIPNWLPYMGGGKYGFLVVNKELFLDLGGNVFVAGSIVKIKVWDLIPTLRKEVLNHKLFKKGGNPDKIPIYYADLSWKVVDSDLQRNQKDELTKLTTIGEVRHRYFSNVRYVKHLEDELATHEATERALDDTLNMNTASRNEVEEESEEE